MLYHFSEEADIPIFTPRLSKGYPELEPAVWAIDESHAVHYYFPRNCPRIIYTKSPDAKQEDIEKFFSFTAAHKIIVIENGWLERIKKVQLYRYSFSDEAFTCINKSAGYYISHQEVIPQRVELYDNLLERIVSANVELRFSPALHALKDAVAASSMDYSIIRFSNAI